MSRKFPRAEGKPTVLAAVPSAYPITFAAEYERDRHFEMEKLSKARQAAADAKLRLAQMRADPSHRVPPIQLAEAEHAYQTAVAKREKSEANLARINAREEMITSEEARFFMRAAQRDLEPEVFHRLRMAAFVAHRTKGKLDPERIAATDPFAHKNAQLTKQK
jgi:hypothetical protein